jgi:DNA replication protein DnaC
MVDSLRIKMDSALNLVYDEWPNFLGSRPRVEALLSRLRHYCHTVTIDGPSLREPQS